MDTGTLIFAKRKGERKESLTCFNADVLNSFPFEVARRMFAITTVTQHFLVKLCITLTIKIKVHVCKNRQLAGSCCTGAGSSAWCSVTTLSSVQFSRSVVSDSLRPHEPQHARPPCPSPTPRVHPNPCPSIESVMPFSHIILCHPLFLLPSIFPSFRVFSNEPALSMRWPKYWSLSFNISPSNEHPGLISFREDWLDLLAVQGTFKSLLQYHSSKASILWQPRRVELGLGWGLCPLDHRRVGHDLVTK